jgi:hypothetical protein
MNATEIILMLLLIRLVIPLSLLLWVGESVQHRRLASFHRISGGL